MNASKPPIDITYNDDKTKDGIKFFGNANIGCNSGVYLTAIKPVLETIHEGWTTDCNDFLIVCDQVSGRQDQSKAHSVCTQLVLQIKDKINHFISHKAVLHFYHTDDKVQVQGSSLVSPGVSAAMWIVKNLIEPLAISHVQSNQETISGINEAILAPSNSQCKYCMNQIYPDTTSVKDQPLPCSRCQRVFHKKCTNRRGSKGNTWHKEPWHCQNCIFADPSAPSLSSKRKITNHPTSYSKR